jgi:dihydroxy-acid dehydratase
MPSLHAIGGVPVVMKELLRHGLLHGDVVTVTGRTLAAEPGRRAGPRGPGRAGPSCTPSSAPLAPPAATSACCAATWRPTAAVLKLSGKTLDKGRFRGPARVFDSEADTMAAIRAGAIQPGTWSWCATSARWAARACPRW